MITLSQKEKVENLFEQKVLGVKTLESKLSEVKKDLKTLKVEQSAAKEDVKAKETKISDLNKIVKILEEKVEVNAKTIKVKDEACKEFKRVSSESNKRLNETQEKLEAMKIQLLKPVKALFHCPLCNYQVEGVTKLRTHLQRNHSRDQKCQTILVTKSKISWSILASTVDLN